MTTAPHAVQAGAGTPESDKARGANAGRVREQGRETSLDSHAGPHTAQALQVLEGEVKARQYLLRLRAEQTAPDELAVVVSMLYGPRLKGFCRVLSKQLEGKHHA